MSDVPARFRFDLEGKTLLGRYRVGREIERGGMGTVYRGEDLDLDGAPVVVKVPLPEVIVQDGFRERFRAEIADLITLRHPRIVRILSRGEENDVPFLVLEYLAGGSLASRLREAPGRLQSPAEVLLWLPAIAEALDFVAKRGVVHRDVKPANILFDEHEHAYLSDFGIAKATASENTITPTGFVQGSPPYMAPEQALGDRVTPAVDQYALATVVYEALSGNKPFVAETPVALFMKKQADVAPDLAAAAHNVSAAAAAAVTKALSKDPAARFPTCTAFLEAFRAGCLSPGVAVPAGHAGLAGPAGPADDATRRAPPPIQNAARRAAPSDEPTIRRGTIVAIAVGFVLLSAGAAWFLGNRPTPVGKPATPPDPAVATAPIDAVAPEIEISEPAEAVREGPEEEPTIRGRAKDEHLKDIRLDGSSIEHWGSDGSFELKISLAPGEARTLVFDAVDEAGNVSAKVVRVIRRTVAAPIPEPAKRRSGPDRVTVEHILIGVKGGAIDTATRTVAEAKAFASRLLADIRGGADWERAKREHSDDPSGSGSYAIANDGVEREGDEAPRTIFVEAFGDLAFSLAVGEIGIAEFDPPKSPFGFHIVRRVK